MKKLLTLFFVCLAELVMAQNSARRYIEQYKNVAITQMKEHGVPASVILGIAMHESGNGKSKNACVLNNHFGIKGHNRHKDFRSKYKSYDSVVASYADFSRILRSRKQFRILFNKYSIYDYKNWVQGIQRGGYASDKAWGKRVIFTIKKYRLYQYDNRPIDYVNPIDEASKTKISKKKTSRHYTIKNGDTLSSIAKKYKTTVTNLRHKNQLKTTRLRIGQKLNI